MDTKKFRVKIKSMMYDLTVFNIGFDMSAYKTPTESRDDEDVIEYSTDATMTQDGDIIRIFYAESSEMGMGNTTTSLIFSIKEPNILNMLRTGENTAGLVFNDKEKRQPCAYSVGNYAMEFCVCTRSIENYITAEGGWLELDYTIEIGGVKTQRTLFRMEAEQCREA